MSGSFERDLCSSINELKFSPEAKDRLANAIIQHGSDLKKSEEKQNMNRFTFGKIAAVAAACILATTGVAVYARGFITRWTTSSFADDYKYTYARKDQLIKESGIDADMPETFSNGYTFEKAAILKVEGSDDDGSVLEDFPQIDIHYTNNDGKNINLCIEDASHADSDDREHTSTRQINGIAVNYDLDEYLFLPPSYEEKGLDPETQKRLDNDTHFFVSIGTEKVEHQQFSNISFIKGGSHYLICGFDTDLTEDDLFDMASEIIALD